MPPGSKGGRLGLRHSIFLTHNMVGDSNIMIALGDMIFKSSYLDFYEQHRKNGPCAGSVGFREVNEPRKYGIVELELHHHVSNSSRKSQSTRPQTLEYQECILYMINRCFFVVFHGCLKTTSRRVVSTIRLKCLVRDYN
ncbi:MAG: hypothetical protein EF812_03000 [Methanosarcinales archaeon]|nr:MAG: hypothetical protein EF812_03000 [Methanosarcinales archaeon]